MKTISPLPNGYKNIIIIIVNFINRFVAAYYVNLKEFDYKE